MSDFYGGDRSGAPEVDAFEELPTNRQERAEVMRDRIDRSGVGEKVCPETGRDLEGVDIIAHARALYPVNIPGSLMSDEALQREAYLYKLAGQNAPRRG